MSPLKLKSLRGMLAYNFIAILHFGTGFSFMLFAQEMNSTNTILLLGLIGFYFVDQGKEYARGYVNFNRGMNGALMILVWTLSLGVAIVITYWEISDPEIIKVIYQWV